MKPLLTTFILAYLKFFAKLQLRKGLFGQIIGITGSVGKSSTRNAIYTVLKQKYHVKASFKANSESGIPLDILGLHMYDYSVTDWLRVLLLAPIQLLTNFTRYDYYIVEMGIDSPHPPKNMSYLLGIIQPDIGVFTSVGLNHAFAFDSLVDPRLTTAAKQKQLKQLIATEKGKLLVNLPPHGQAIFNSDDPYIQAVGQQSQAAKHTFGFKPTAATRCHAHQLRWHNQQLTSSFTFQLHDNNLHGKTTTEQLELSFSTYLLFAQYAYNLAPAIILGRQAGIDSTTIKSALERELVLPAGRTSLLAGKNHALLVDSSYNASGMLDMLHAFNAISTKSGRKLVLLGDMRELGHSTQNLHEQLAEFLLQSDIKQAFLVGQSMQQFVLPILAKHSFPVQHFATATAAGQAIAKQITKNDILLVKGSQNTIFLEEAVATLLAHPKRDRHKLCRQESSWVKLKQQPLASS